MEMLSMQHMSSELDMTNCSTAVKVAQRYIMETDEVNKMKTKLYLGCLCRPVPCPSISQALFALPVEHDFNLHWCWRWVSIWRNGYGLGSGKEEFIVCQLTYWGPWTVDILVLILQRWLKNCRHDGLDVRTSQIFQWKGVRFPHGCQARQVLSRWQHSTKIYEGNVWSVTEGLFRKCANFLRGEVMEWHRRNHESELY